MKCGERHRVPEGFDAADLVRTMPGDRDAEILDSVRVKTTYLDTFDWRIHRLGGVLVFEKYPKHRVLRWLKPGNAPHSVPLQTAPRTAGELPSEYLQRKLAAALGVRALLPVGVTVTERSDVRVVDSDGNILLRLGRERTVVMNADDSPEGDPVHAVTVEAVPGQTEVYADALAVLGDKGLGEIPDTDLEYASGVRGRSPGDYSSKLAIRLQRSSPAENALRVILLDLLDTMERNVEGVIDDLDSEFLHDFRVACRRTRSALTQLKGVLPHASVARFLEEFKWLGTVTGPCRDLDVFLIDMEDFGVLLNPDQIAKLAPLESLVGRERRKAQRSVVRALRTKRFARLVSEWRTYLEDDSTGINGDAADPIEELAAARIRKAYKRILRRGSRLLNDPVPDELHRLRIDAKKLRYLLEFFRSLYEPGPVDGLVKELKKVQDILGGFNDTEIQQNRIRAFASDLGGTLPAPTDTLLAMGRLEAALEQRQEQYRLAFGKRFETFSSSKGKARFAAVFGKN